MTDNNHYEIARDVCSTIENEVHKIGWHVALTGGSLYKEGTRKDIDMILYQDNNVEYHDKLDVLDTLTIDLGLSINHDRSSPDQNYYDIRMPGIDDLTIDMFIFERSLLQMPRGQHSEGVDLGRMDSGIGSIPSNSINSSWANLTYIEFLNSINVDPYRNHNNRTYQQAWINSRRRAGRSTNLNYTVDTANRRIIDNDAEMRESVRQVNERLGVTHSHATPYSGGRTFDPSTLRTATYTSSIMGFDVYEPDNSGVSTDLATVREQNVAIDQQLDELERAGTVAQISADAAAIARYAGSSTTVEVNAAGPAPWEV